MVLKFVTEEYTTIIHADIQVHLKKIYYGEKVSCNLFEKVKLSYILDSLHVK